MRRLVSGWQHVVQTGCSLCSFSCALVCVWFLEPPIQEAHWRVSLPHLIGWTGTLAVSLMFYSLLDGRMATRSLFFRSHPACGSRIAHTFPVDLLDLCRHCGIGHVGWTLWLAVCGLKFEPSMCPYIAGFRQTPANQGAADYCYFLCKSDGLETPSSSR